MSVMTRRAMRCAWLGTLAVALSGCAALLVGAGAAGGYALSRDSIRNTFDLPQSRVFYVSREVFGELGFVTVEDATRGLLKGAVNGAQITITVKPVTEKAVELKVRARNAFWLPRLETAERIYNRVLKQLG